MILNIFSISTFISGFRELDGNRLRFPKTPKASHTLLGRSRASYQGELNLDLNNRSIDFHLNLKSPPIDLFQETLAKRAADIIEHFFSASGNPHHFALPTPPSDHEGETSRLFVYEIKNLRLWSCLIKTLTHLYHPGYNNGFTNTFDGK